MPVDPTIASRVAGNVAGGFDIGQIYGEALKLRQFQTELQSQNTLKQLLSQPGAVDPKTGSISPNTLATFTRLYPQQGLQLLDQQSQTEERRAQTAHAQSETQAAETKAAASALSDSLAAYDGELASGNVSQDVATQNLKSSLHDWIEAQPWSQQKKDQNWQVLSSLSPAQLRSVAQKFSMGEAQREQQGKRTFATMGGQPVQVDEEGNVYDPNSGQKVPVTAPVEKEPTALDPQAAALRQESVDIQNKRLALAEKVAAGGAAALSPEDLDFAAELVLDGQPMPNMGFGAAGAAARGKILHRAAEMASAQGGTAAGGADTAVFRKEALRSDTSALTQAEKQRTSIEQNAPTTLKFLDRIDELAKKVSLKYGPNVFNRSLVDFKAKFGSDPDAQALITDMADVAPEQAKIMSGSTGSVAAASDEAARRVDAMINYGMPLSSLEGAIHEIRQGIGWRRQNASEAVNQARAQLKGDTGGGAGDLQGVPGDQPPPAPPGGKKLSAGSIAQWKSLPASRKEEAKRAAEQAGFDVSVLK